jgi:D-threo-aldose 1-dehydrogenase
VIGIGRLALGCAPLAGLYEPVEEATAQAAMDAAWEAGIRTFDTAPLYGLGVSEQRVGAALATRPRDEFVLSTKVGRLLVPSEGPPSPDMAIFPGAPALEATWDYSHDGVRRSLEASLERLGLDRVDIALIHDPDDHMDAALYEAYPALEELRSQRVLRAIGAGMNQTPALARFVRETDVDCVLVAGRYTLLDQSAGDDLLPACLDRGVAVLAAGVFNSGVLADPDASPTYDYAPAPREVISRARRIAAVCARYEIPLTAAAMAFPLRHPAVKAVVVGARSRQEVAANATAFGRPIPQALWDELQAEGLLQ